MENKDQNVTGFIGDTQSGVALDYGVVKEPPDPNALSLEPISAGPLISQEQPKGQVTGFRRFARRLDVLLAALLLIAGAAVLFSVTRGGTTGDEDANTAANSFGTVKIPLNDLLEGKNLNISGAASVTINGPMQLNDGLVVTPSVQPTGATPGQIYYDNATNQLAYFNGEVFVFLTSPEATPGGVQSLGGATGQLTLGSGLNINNNQITNSGVLSVQGQNGNVTLTAGPGIVINGTTFSNSGVISVASGSPNVSVVDDGEGNVTLSVTSGTGTITSSGGTAGTIPVYTASQNIEDSIVTQSGLTVTISGDLSVVTGGLTLSNALTVSNGGTGATSFANNGVLVGNGTAAVTAVAAGGAGLCLLSTAGAPTWGACPGASGVSSLNGLTGALSIANASAAGSTITIDDATTASKGIASFNSSNFTVVGGAVNTIQNIGTGSTPTFAGVNTNAITPSAALTVGATSQTLILQGGASTTLSATSGANSTTISFQAPTAAVTYRFATAAAGTYDVCTTIGNCVGTGGGVSTAGGTTNQLAKFSGTQAIADSTISDDGTTVSTTVDLTVQGGEITVGVPSSQTGSLQLAHNGSSFTGTIVQGALTGNRTYTLPDANGTICLSSGNCSGSGSSNTLQAAYDAGNSITTTDARDLDVVLANTATDSNFDLVIADGSTGYVSFGRANGAGTSDPAQILLVANNDIDRAVPIGINVQAAAGGFTTAIDVSDTDIGTALSVGANNIVGTTGNLTFTNFSVNGTSGDVTAGGDMNLSGGGQYQISGVQISSSALSNDSNLAKLSASQTFTGNTVAFQNGGNSTNAFNVQNAAGTRIMTVDTTGGQIVLGAGSSLDGKLVFHSVSSNNTVTVLTETLTANRTITLPDADGIICTDSGNCAGAGATLQTAYNFSVGGTTPKIKVNSSLGGVDIQDADTTIGANLFNIRASNAGGLGSVMFGVGSTGEVTLQNSANSTTAFSLLTAGGTSVLTGDTTNGDIILGQSGTLSGSLVFNNATNANTVTIATAVPSVNRTITLPNATGTICVSSGNCSGAGSSNTLQAAYDAGNTITTTNTRDIQFQLTDTATDPNFTIDLQCDTTCGSNGRFAIQDDGVDVFTVAPAGGAVTMQGSATVEGSLAANGNVTLGNAATDLITLTGTVQGANAAVFEGATADGFETTLAVADPTADHTITLPNESGTVCLQGATSCGFAAATGATGYIWNSATVQSANFYVQAASSGSVAAVIQANAAGSGDILDLKNGAGTNIATFSSIGAALFQNSFDSVNALTVQDAVGTTTLMNIDSSNKRVGIGGTASFSRFEVIDGDAAVYNSGNNPRIILGDSTADGQNGFLQWDSTEDYIRIETVGTNGVKIDDNFVTIGNIFPDQPLKVANGSTLLYEISTTGAVLSQNSSNSTTAFRILNAGSVPLFVADTSNSRIYIGNPTNDATGALLVLDSYNNASDPTGTNGGMYYNSNTGKFRCYENGVWKNCLGLSEAITIFGQNGAGASSLWTNMPAALTELMMGSGPVGNPASRTRYDLTEAEQARFIVNCETGGATNAEIRIQYSTDQTTWNYLDAANTGLGQNIDLPGTDVSAWADIAAGAKADVYLRAVGINGDGANDPTLGLIQLQVR